MLPVADALGQRGGLEIGRAVLHLASRRSLHELGEACFEELASTTPSSAIGLYVIAEGARPSLLYSRNAPSRLIREYETVIGADDPFLYHIRKSRRPVDGASLFGGSGSGWQSSPNFVLLNSVGLRNCMAGPLEFNGEILGMIFTATADERPFHIDSLECMRLFTEAASLSIQALIETRRLVGPPSDWLRQVHPQATSSETDAARFGTLAKRSREVATLLCEGQSNKEIARVMNISAYTVKEHIEGLCRRFAVRNRTELAVRLFAQIRADRL